jgi:hypothetical protein
MWNFRSGQAFFGAFLVSGNQGIAHRVKFWVYFPFSTKKKIIFVLYCQRVGNRIFSNPPLTFCVHFVCILCAIIVSNLYNYFSCLHLKPWFPDSMRRVS